MAEWRIGRSWSDAELKAGLEKAKHLPLNFPLEGPESQEGKNWQRYYSESIIAKEKTGAPEAEGPFFIAWKAIQEYQFSDPAIVTGHFNPQDPLPARPMLLEVKAFGLHYLCPARVGSLREKRTKTETQYAFRYDTLEGHIEEGSEWFLLTKNHETGEIWFRISASWRPGAFPNWWSKVGFIAFSGKFHLAWHRLAYLRLRQIASNGGKDLVPLPRGEKLFHTGAEISQSDIWILNEPSVSKRVRQAGKEEQAITEAEGAKPSSSSRRPA